MELIIKKKLNLIFSNIVKFKMIILIFLNKKRKNNSK